MVAAAYTQFQDRYSATKSYSFGHMGDESSLKECQLLRHDNGIELGASIMESRALPILLKMFQTSSIIFEIIALNGNGGRDMNECCLHCYVMAQLVLLVGHMYVRHSGGEL